MWEQDWALLGIEPTTELTAIKKAYALKLKTTRPDDDAEAYQALRGAYERVQQWLKWQQQQAAMPAPEPAVAPPTVVEATPPAPAAPLTLDQPVTPSTPPTPTPPQPQQATPAPLASPPTAADTTPAPEVQPQQLTAALEGRWSLAGDAALREAWETTRRELDQQPLSRQSEFSTAFAQWALGLPTLPNDFLKTLDSYFGWLHDFRSERLLGPALVQALNERLRPRPVDPAVRAVGDPLVRLQAARLAGVGWLKLQWWLFLLQPVFGRSQSMLGVQWLQLLGLDLEAQRWLRAAVQRGLWWRTGAAALIYGTCAGLVFSKPLAVVAHTLVWLALTALLLVLGMLGGTLLGVQLQAINPSARRWSHLLPEWTRDVGALGLGIMWLLFAAWLTGVDAQASVSAVREWLPFVPRRIVEYATWGFALCGLAMARPRGGMSRYVVAGLFPITAFLAMRWLDAWLPPTGACFIAAAWLLAGAAVHEDRFGQAAPAPVQWFLRPVLNTLVLADRWTYVTALAPLAVAMGYATLVDGQVRPLSLFMCWVLGILAVGWLQTQADALGLRLLPAPPAPPDSADAP